MMVVNYEYDVFGIRKGEAAPLRKKKTRPLEVMYNVLTNRGFNKENMLRRREN